MSRMPTFAQKNEYGGRIRTERVRLGYTQAEWAKACGVSKTSQVSYEAGTYKPDVAYLSRAVSVGADPMYLLAGRPLSAGTAAEFDWKLAEEIMASIDLWADDKPKPTTTAIRMRLLKLFYSQFAATGVIDNDDLQKSLAMLGS